MYCKPFLPQLVKGQALRLPRRKVTCTWDGTPHTLSVKGRHDPCVLPRAPPLVEGMSPGWKSHEPHAKPTNQLVAWSIMNVNFQV